MRLLFFPLVFSIFAIFSIFANIIRYQHTLAVTKQKAYFTIVGLLVLVLLGFSLYKLDIERALSALREASWGLTFAALFFTVVSYFCAGVSFVYANRIFGINFPSYELFTVGFVSTVLNNVTATGGLAGHSLRTIVLKRKEITISKILAISLFHSYFNNLIFFAFFPIGLGYLLTTGKLGSIGTSVIVLLLVIFTALFLVSSGMIFSEPLRNVVLKIITHAVRLTTGRDVGAQIDQFHIAMNEGIGSINKSRQFATNMALFIIFDWMGSVLALGFCFDALGEPVKLGLLITGFTIGFTLGVLSMIPGGLGVQDSSMVGVFTLLGVPIEKAILAILLFRLLYYFLPLLLSVSFYRELLKQKSV